MISADDNNMIMTSWTSLSSASQPDCCCYVIFSKLYIMNFCTM